MLMLLSILAIIFVMAESLMGKVKPRPKSINSQNFRCPGSLKDALKRSRKGMVLSQDSVVTGEYSSFLFCVSAVDSFQFRHHSSPYVMSSVLDCLMLSELLDTLFNSPLQREVLIFCMYFTDSSHVHYYI